MRKKKVKFIFGGKERSARVECCIHHRTDIATCTYTANAHRLHVQASRLQQKGREIDIPNATIKILFNYIK